MWAKHPKLGQIHDPINCAQCFRGPGAAGANGFPSGDEAIGSDAPEQSTVETEDGRQVVDNRDTSIRPGEGTRVPDQEAAWYAAHAEIPGRASAEIPTLHAEAAEAKATRMSAEGREGAADALRKDAEQYRLDATKDIRIARIEAQRAVGLLENLRAIADELDLIVRKGQAINEQQPGIVEQGLAGARDQSNFEAEQLA